MYLRVRDDVLDSRFPSSHSCHLVMVASYKVSKIAPVSVGAGEILGAIFLLFSVLPSAWLTCCCYQRAVVEVAACASDKFVTHAVKSSALTVFDRGNVRASTTPYRLSFLWSEVFAFVVAEVWRHV